MNTKPTTALPGLSKGRVEALTDGIFATVMTVLVLSLSAPVITGALPTELNSEVTMSIQKLLPDIVGYVISFLILGVMWVSHHAVFNYIQKMNRSLLWLNMIFLLTIGFVPFSTALLGRYPQLQIPVIIYGANILSISITMQAFLWYAVRNKIIVTEEGGETVVKRILSRWRLGSFIYAGAIVLSFVNPVISVIIYGLALIYFVITSSFGSILKPQSHDAQTSLSPKT
ncbi:MAG: TMEM175 family protein [Thaumarchaeota archaeon]|nr:TMEM175 family protein [Nitrososphaerota archaeon]